jgi:hypothetical protein
VSGLRKWSRPALPVLVWLAVFGISLFRVHFLNDHFDRISRGRQILAHGDVPFADFRDPGYFLTLYVSAAAQAATGGGLLGEALVSSGAIATASALTFVLAQSASGSWIVALAAAALTVAVAPRYYDYDKALFYTLGLALCWRFVDSPTRGRLAAAGLTTGVAALFRYDNGLFLFVASVAAIVVRLFATPSRLVPALAMYIAGVTAVVLPAMVFIQSTAGVPEAARQIVAYARREGARSELFGMPKLSWDVTSLVFVFVVTTIPTALVVLGLRARRTVSPLTFSAAKIVAAAILAGCVSVFILREPLMARLGAAVPLGVVLAAWLIGCWLRPAYRPLTSVGYVAAVVLVLMAVAWPAVRFRRVRSAAVRLAAVSEQGSAIPRSYLPESGALGGLSAYLHACTPPDARVLVTWFAPEVFFFAERGFAGGMAVFLGNHWSSDADQRRTVEQLASQQVPLVVMQSASAAEMRLTFPRIATYLDETFRPAGASSFDDPRVGADGYQVLIRKDLGNPPADTTWGLPCPK